MFRWLLKKYDRLMYRLAQPSISRILKADAGMAYMFQQAINDHCEKNPPTDAQRIAAELAMGGVGASKAEREKLVREIMSRDDPYSGAG